MYLSQLDTADRKGDAVPEAKITRLNEKIAALRREIQRLTQLRHLTPSCLEPIFESRPMLSFTYVR